MALVTAAWMPSQAIPIASHDRSTSRPSLCGAIENAPHSATEPLRSHLRSLEPTGQFGEARCLATLMLSPQGAAFRPLVG